MAYIGNQQTQGFSSRPSKQDLTGATGTSLTLSHAVASAEGIDLFINNVRQEPTTAYSVVGTAVTLTGSVAASDDIYVVYNSLALQTSVVPDASVSTAKIIDGNVTAAKLANTLDLSAKSLTMPTGAILQVKSATKTDKQDTASTTPQDITGLSVAITPSSTSSEMLVRCDINCGGYNNTYIAFFVKRDSADMLVSTAVSGSLQIKSTFTHSFNDVNSQEYKLSGVSHSYLDSPATTSEIIYKVQFASTAGGTTATINAPYNNTNAAFIIGGTSTITVMEIAG